ncbi:hypothetical protein K458DRAFT_392045 [Lentithecium fluviatile CBS 122367]|uniref:Uncharacterized protein n=1 Tax=Lentithecium fluviatile CBS 122367 TaxID=1168545 RepID=A0A6G1ISW9_9PLEO|nr:hypothetical protein K458DRAFT_392045 [Lentithecium fluviatile CBS 122367]
MLFRPYPRDPPSQSLPPQDDHPRPDLEMRSKVHPPPRLQSLSYGLRKRSVPNVIVSKRRRIYSQNPDIPTAHRIKSPVVESMSDQSRRLSNKATTMGCSSAKDTQEATGNHLWPWEVPSLILGLAIQVPPQPSCNLASASMRRTWILGASDRFRARRTYVRGLVYAAIRRDKADADYGLVHRIL